MSHITPEWFSESLMGLLIYFFICAFVCTPSFSLSLSFFSDVAIQPLYKYSETDTNLDLWFQQMAERINEK